MQAQSFSVLGLAVVCLLQAQAEVPIQPGFQQDQFVGNWYGIGFASNSRWFKEKKSVMKMCTTVVTPMEDGNLEVASTYPKLDQCETRKTVFIRTVEPGRFTYTSTRTGSQHDVRVVETNYSEFALVHVKKVREAESFTMVTLYGRSKELRPELLQKFTQLALAEGLAEENILILPKTDRCMVETV